MPERMKAPHRHPQPSFEAFSLVTMSCRVGVLLGDRHHRDAIVFGPMSSIDLVLQHAPEIRAVAAALGARDARLVGSAARGSDSDERDIDLVVTFDAGIGLLSHAKLLLALEHLLGRKVDVASDRGVRPAVRQNLERDARAL